MADKTKYKLVKGKHSGFDEEGNPKNFVAGDWVFLTDEQAKAFSGKVKAEALIVAEATLAGLDLEKAKTETAPGPEITPVLAKPGTPAK